MLIRKFHLYIALLLGPFFVLLGLSGSWVALYPEIDSWLLDFEPRRSSQATRAQISWQRVVDVAAAEFATVPGMTMIHFPFGETGPVYVMVPTGPRMFDVGAAYVDPGSASVLASKHMLAAEQSWEKNSTGLAVVTHLALFMGPVGYVFIGIIGAWVLVILGTGIWMWWPRGQWRRTAFAITSRPGSRLFLGDLHRVSGLYAVPLLIIVTLTGVYLALEPYLEPAVNAVASVTPPVSVNHSPASHTSHTQTTPPQASHHAHKAEDGKVDLDSAVAAARALFPDRGLRAIDLVRNDGVVYKISLAPFDGGAGRVGTTDVVIDSAGRVQEIRDPGAETPADAVIRWANPLHTGHAFGTVGRWILAVLGLLPAAFLFTGVWVWLRRTQRTRLVAAHA